MITSVSLTSDSNNNEICNTKTCQEEAKVIINSMKTSIDPCDNFYEFACGNFNENKPIPEEKVSFMNYDIILELLNNQLKTILESSNQYSESSAYKKTLDVYKACMSENTIEENGMQNFRNKLNDIGGWPVLGNNYKDEVWYKTLIQLAKNGFSHNIIFSLNVDADYNDSKKRIIFLDQATLGLNRHSLRKGINDDKVQDYLSYMKKVALYLGANKDTVTEDMENVVYFEIELEKLQSSIVDRRNIQRMTNPMTIKDLAENINSDIPWLEYINSILQFEEVNQEEVINVSEVKYLQDVMKLLKTTSSRVVTNYLVWMAIMNYVKYLPKEGENIYEEYYKKQHDVKTMLPRWKRCAAETNNDMTAAVGSLYVRKHFSEDVKIYLKNIIDSIRSEFVSSLKESEWMDETTKNKALKKLSYMKDQIGYPPELLNIALIDELYKDLSVKQDEYLLNSLNIRMYSLKYTYSQLREPIIKIDWRRNSYVADINAYYDWQNNFMLIKAGILQGIYFNKDRPLYMNYGSTGVIVGHEIIHGFDDMGKGFDYEGNSVNWWEDSTSSKFDERKKCIIDQYNKYDFPSINMTVNGTQTQGENIADNAGVRLSYIAYLKKEKELNEKIQLLPGLSYNSRQLYWITFANLWCSQIRDTALQRFLNNKLHSPSKYRVIGPLSNNKDFARDFNCPVGSPMNPQQKCNVW